MPTFGWNEYQAYMAAQKHADNMFVLYGETTEQREAQKEANACFMRYEYAAGLRSLND